MQFSKETLKGAAEVIVLKALEDSEAYGYELIERIARTSNNIFEFQEGTLYPLLYRLEDRGDVESYEALAPSGKKRRYYKLTDEGKKLLGTKNKEYASFVSGLTQVLNLRHAS